jgi:3-oxoacyl-[acyl-carrier protein] reductase
VAGVPANAATRCFKRPETPEDLVGAVLYFSSADSDFVTGQTLLVDGGAVFN